MFSISGGQTPLSFWRLASNSEPSFRPENQLLHTHFFHESEMTLFSECMLQCARRVLDTADIAGHAIRQFGPS
jgi:hypothetical protein